jgi:transposase-like protein
VGHGVVRLASPFQPWQALGHDDNPQPHRGLRYPAEVIQRAAWLYHCFSLSPRDVELIPAARGTVVSYETIRGWSLCFRRTARSQVGAGPS